MRQISLCMLSIIILVALFIQPAQAQSIHLNLAPHGSKLIENHYLFSLDATCIIESSEQNNMIKLHVIENTGTVNGKHLTRGQATSIVVNNQDALSVSAEPGSKVNVLNLSDNTVQANCSV